MMAKRSAVLKESHRPKVTDICDMPQLKRKLGGVREFDVGLEWGAVGAADPP